MSDNNIQFCIDRLADLKGFWPEIADEVEVSYSWLCQFAKNKIPDPSHKRIVRLSENLKARAKKARK
jgi:hypothetical protein